MTIINLAMRASSFTNWNAIGSVNSTGTKVPSGSVVDSTNSVVSGVAIAVMSRFDGFLAGSGLDNADSYPSVVKTDTCGNDSATYGDCTVRYTGLTSGNWQVTVYGNNDYSTANRGCTVTATAQSGSTNNATYDAAGGFGIGSEASRTATVAAVTLGSGDYLDISFHDTGAGGKSYSNAIILTSASDTTAPSLTVGPTASSITSAGFTISGTPDEAGTAFLIVTAVGASQPSNGTFDASAETASMTAATNFNIVHTGQ